MCSYLAEAAAVVLANFHNPPPPPTPMVLDDGAHRVPAELSWTAPDAIQRSSHANEPEAVRDAASAVAIAAVHARSGYIVRKRPHHGSGADWLMSRLDDPEGQFIRLEVSGTARGRDSELRVRLTEKRAQLRRGRDPTSRPGRPDMTPGIAVVVAFKAGIIRMEAA